MLFPKSFSGNKKEEHGKNMATLMKILNGKLAIGNRTRPFVKHYMDSYGAVPLWILQNDLTFGNMEHFHQLQKRSVQNGACKIVLEVSGRDARITPHELLRIFSVLVGFRNMCAHSERLYCAEVRGANLSEMINLLSAVLPSDETKELENTLSARIRKYPKSSITSAVELILDGMRLTTSQTWEPPEDQDEETG